MKLDVSTCRRLFAGARVARLATIGGDGPHIVPIVFALDGNTVVSVVDAKPKSTRNLRRLANLVEEPRAALLADAYAEDWDRLWWVRADVLARVTSEPAAIEAALRSLRARYRQYRAPPPAGPVIEMTVRRWVGWAAAPSAVVG